MLKTTIEPKIIELLKERKDSYFFGNAELNYLKGDKPVNAKYERVLLHRVFKKLEYLEKRVCRS